MGFQSRENTVGERLRFCFRLLLVVAILLLIYFFSAQPAEDSSEISLGLLHKLFAFFRLELPMAAEGLYHHLLRKTAHFVAYFSLGWSMTRVTRSRAFFPKFPTVTVLGALFAALDEWHQSFVPGRGPGVGDVFLDTCGVAAGCIFTLLAAWLICRIRKNKA